MTKFDNNNINSDSLENEADGKLFSKFSTSEIIFIALMVAANVGFDIIVSPGFIALTTHIVAGLMIMVPINFIFMGLVKFSVKKFGTLTIYMTIFGTICTPLTFWGGTAGIWKIGLGLIIGLLLDIAFLPKINEYFRIFIVGIVGSIIWWLPTFIIWEALNLPVVLGFSSMLNSASPVFNGLIDLSSVINLPITAINGDLVIFSILCGLISAGPVIVGLFVSYSIYKKIEKTAVYERFRNNNQIL